MAHGAEIMAPTEWQPNTVRGFLSILRAGNSFKQLIDQTPPRPPFSGAFHGFCSQFGEGRTHTFSPRPKGSA
jgi:hypothetical protein